MKIEDIINEGNIYTLVGMNSQGKTYTLNDFYKRHKEETIYIANEVKADESLKNSVDSSPLILWLERLLSISDIQKLIEEQLNDIDLTDINSKSNVSVELKSSAKNYKGLITTEIKTESNTWKKAGSGETFLAELLLVEKMLTTGTNNPIKYLIIDEPETFLHPSLYISVCSTLKRISTYSKILISTHSPKIVNYITEDINEIILVERGELKQLKSSQEYINLMDKNIVYNSEPLLTTTRKAKDKMNEYFNIFIKPKLINCLFSKIVIIGEGMAEQVLFNCFKSKKENKDYIGIIEFETLYGKDFIPLFSDIIKDIGLIPIIIFDKDVNVKNNPDAHKKINKYIEENNEYIISFENNIEEYLELDDSEKNSPGYKAINVPIQIEIAFLNDDLKINKLIDDIENTIIQISDKYKKNQII